MTNYARIRDMIAIDLSSDPSEDFHPLIAAEFIEVPDEVERLWRLSESGDWSAPPPPPPPDPEPEAEPEPE